LFCEPPLDLIREKNYSELFKYFFQILFRFNPNECSSIFGSSLHFRETSSYSNYPLQSITMNSIKESGNVKTEILNISPKTLFLSDLSEYYETFCPTIAKIDHTLMP
jgi:hypothetical protein